MPWVLWVVMGAVALRGAAGLLVLWDRRAPKRAPQQRYLSGTAERNPRSRRLLATMRTDDRAIAPPAGMGLSSPAAATGSPTAI